MKSCLSAGRPSRIYVATFLLCSHLFDLLIAVDYRLYEEAPIGTSVGNPAIDAGIFDEIGAADQLRFHISKCRVPGRRPSSGYPQDGCCVSIQDRIGEMRIAKRIDREEICRGLTDCHLVLEVIVSPVEYFRVIIVNVTILDVNDNKPLFPEDVIDVSIPESFAVGNFFPIPSASDPDGPEFGIVEYSMAVEGMVEDGPFRLEQTSGGSVRMVLIQAIDRETRQFYNIRVTATDGGLPAHSSVLVVNLTVLDVNDHSPIFERDFYYAHLAENQTGYPQTIHLTRVHAVDDDEEENGRVVYTLEPTITSADLFGIDVTSGDVFFCGKRHLDRETDPEYQLVVIATDSAVPRSQRRTSSASVIVIVDDVNDFPPEIYVNTLTTDGVARISEAAEVGTFVALVSVADSDAEDNGRVDCDLATSDRFQLQQLHPGEYKVVSVVPLDREIQAAYHLDIRCQDRGIPPLSSLHRLQVHVTDTNDCDPVFTRSRFVFSLKENNEVGSEVGQLEATDEDEGINSRYSFSFLGRNRGLQVDPRSGVLTADVAFDYERTNEVTLTAVVTDHGHPSRSSTVLVAIEIRNKNDDPPIFDSVKYKFSVRENQSSGTILGKVSAHDTDTDEQHGYVLRYSLVETPDVEALSATVVPFSINADTGVIYTSAVLDREVHPHFSLVAAATERSTSNPSQTRTSLVNVTVFVEDVNDNHPVVQVLSNSTVFITNLNDTDTFVAQIVASDVDQGPNGELVYSLSDPLNSTEDGRSCFSIEPNSGIIFINCSDRSRISGKHFRLGVVVSDCGLPSLSTQTNIDVIILGDSLAASVVSSEDDVDMGEISPNVAILSIILFVSVMLVSVLSTGIFVVRYYLNTHSENIYTP